jgi:type VI secretion system protein ImpK
MDRTAALTKDCFNAVNQLRALSGNESVSPELVHRRMRELIERFFIKAREQGVLDRDARDMGYAIVALADEIAIANPGLAGFWRENLLQMRYFDENIAGEGFFRKLESLRRDHRRVDVLRTFYTCLLLGFEGYHLGRSEGELRRLMDSVASEVEQGIRYNDALSPDGERPDDAMLRRRERHPLLWIAVASFATALALYIGLRVVLNGQTDTVVKALRILEPAPGPPPVERLR